MTGGRPHVLVVGAGFGGLQCAKALRGHPVDVTIVDPRDYHLFTPLLYQVASCLLSPSDVAAPIRKVFRNAPNVRYRLDEVVGLDHAAHRATLASGASLVYDACVIATGSVTNFYGNSTIEEHALGLKDLGEALQLRNHVLTCFERATITDDDTERERLLTFCIVGAGPTGVEYAGALAEFVRLVVPREYPEIAPSGVRILLLEGGDRVLAPFKPRLSRYTARQLARLGVELRTETLVTSADALAIVLHDGTELPTATMVWTAGVKPRSPLPSDDAHTLGRVEVDQHFRVEGTTDTYAIGDTARGPGPQGSVLPMQAPPAMQAGRYVAAEILGIPSGPFRYRDKGMLATIGRRAAVGQIGPLTFTGGIGWLAWLVVHLYYLIGFENRVRVVLRWAWYYVRLDRPVRIILRADEPRH
jgi:NADH:ubiquinone reductase (H+-translocating)